MNIISAEQLSVIQALIDHAAKLQSVVDVITAPKPIVEPGKDLLTAKERDLIEAMRIVSPAYTIDKKNYNDLLAVLDRLAPKPVEAVKPVSGWDAIEDMRKRPEARYRAFGFMLIWQGKLGYLSGFGTFVPTELPMSYLDAVMWIKVS